jgi:hypothetical protein
LSFLDTLSCGLGATVLLFLVFSALPHHGAQASNGSGGMSGTNLGINATRRYASGGGEHRGVAFADVAARHRAVGPIAGEWRHLPENAQREQPRRDGAEVSIGAFLPNGLPRQALLFALPTSVVTAEETVKFTLKQGGQLLRHEVVVKPTTPRSVDGHHFLLTIQRVDWRS